MIRTDGVVKLMDFGIASSCDAKESSRTISLTPMYAAPEMFNPQGGSPAGDYYSLGVMAYELITGQLPFVAEDLEDWRRRHQTVPAPVLNERDAQTPADLAHFVNAALMKAPAARFRAVQRCLQQWKLNSTPCLVSHPPAVPSVVSRAGQDSETILSP